MLLLIIYFQNKSRSGCAKKMERKITYTIKIIKTIYKLHYIINVLAEPLEVAREVLGFCETRFENPWFLLL
jgi:hypothetical protein